MTSHGSKPELAGGNFRPLIWREGNTSKVRSQIRRVFLHVLQFSAFLALSPILYAWISMTATKTDGNDRGRGHPPGGHEGMPLALKTSITYNEFKILK